VVEEYKGAKVGKNSVFVEGIRRYNAGEITEWGGERKGEGL
jgi:hypothetical protein